MQCRIAVALAVGVCSLGVVGCTERAPSAGPTVTTTTLRVQASAPATLPAMTDANKAAADAAAGAAAATKKASDTVAGAADQFAQQRDKAVQTMQSQLTSLTTRATALGDQAATKGFDVKAAYALIKPEIDKKLADLRATLDSAKTATPDTLTKLTDTFKAGVDGLTALLDKAAQQVK